MSNSNNTSRSTILVINASLNKKQSLSTDATTWGELRNILEEEGLSRGDVKAVLKETGTSLEMDGAQIPEGNSTLFIVPKKSKAGLDDEYNDMSFSELRTECSRRDSVVGRNGNYGSSETMRDLLRADDESDSCDCDSTDMSQVRQKLVEAISIIDGSSSTEEGITAEDFAFAETVENM